MNTKTVVSQDEIRAHLGARDGVRVQVASEGDGSPELAWGDTFFYVRGADGEHGKMPFATILTKDYDGFDCDSQLNRGGLFRLNGWVSIVNPAESSRAEVLALLDFSFDRHQVKKSV